MQRQVLSSIQNIWTDIHFLRGFSILLGLNRHSDIVLSRGAFFIPGGEEHAVSGKVPPPLDTETLIKNVS